MYKFLFTCLLGTLTILPALSQQTKHLTDNLYGVKHGTIHYKSSSVMNFPGQPPLTTHATGKVYFDDYGKKRSNIYTETQDVAEFKVNRNLQTIYIDDYKYSIDLDTKKGTEDKVNERLDKITNYDRPDDADKNLFTFTLTGAGTFLDKPCRLYTVTENQGTESVSRVTVWNNIVLKRVTSSPVLTYTFEVTKIEESQPDATLLSIPDDVVIE